MTAVVYQPCCKSFGTMLSFILCMTTSAIFYEERRHKP